MKYLIWATGYTHASGGPKVLHRLCHELNAVGQEAYIGNGYTTNPEWNTPHGNMDDDTIGIYPEVVSGNPWGARRVARWVLNVPGLLGGDRSYAIGEMVFSWAREFLDGVPLLHLPGIELDIYTDRALPRNGELFYVGRGIQGDTSGASEITWEMRANRYALADALNHATLLRCFDYVTAMKEIALLCGCPVLMPDGQRLEPFGFRDEYLALWPVFRNQLAEFIRITQGAA